MGSGSASRIERPNALRERIDYLFAYAFARPESEQNSSLRDQLESQRLLQSRPTLLNQLQEEHFSGGSPHVVLCSDGITVIDHRFGCCDLL